MKTSRYSKALILSLSAVLLVASGCERRGRAPVKATTSDGGAKTVVKDNKVTPIVPVNTPSSTPSNIQTTIVDQTDPAEAKKEADLIQIAEMDCAKDLTINENASASKDQFLGDLDILRKFQVCMNQSGLVLDCKDAAGSTCKAETKAEDQVYTVESSPDPKDKSPAFLEFARLTDAKGNVDDAGRVMNARIDLSILRLGKLGKKYTADRLRSADIGLTDSVLDRNNSPTTISDQLIISEKFMKALDDSHKDIDAMITNSVSDGIDHTKDAVSEDAQAE
jgi:hypothetical protein